MGRQEIPALLIGLLVSVALVAVGDRCASGVTFEENAASAPEASAEKERAEAEGSEPVPMSTGVENRWKEIYRGVLATPQSMIGGYEANAAALDDFVARTRPVPTEVSAAWKTVLRLKSEAWDERTCVRYQRAKFTICEHERVTSCHEQLERALSDCEACSSDGTCGRP